MKQSTGLKQVPLWLWALGVLIILALWTVSVYNGLVMKDGAVQSAWSQVEVQYQRRADLVPQLVATVQGAADFEQSTLTEVTEARTNWLSTQGNPDATVDEQILASQQFDSALSRLLVSVEAYPTLTATENFQTLQSQLEGTENRISVARMDYNTATTTYNVAIRRFPTNIVAGLLGFDGATLFEGQEGSENAPEVDFEFNN